MPEATHQEVQRQCSFPDYFFLAAFCFDVFIFGRIYNKVLESFRKAIKKLHGFPKITRKVVSALYRVSLHTRYHEKLAAASAHLLLVKILTIPNLPEQAYTETVLAMTLLFQDKEELQQQLIDSSMRPAGAPPSSALQHHR